MSMDGEQRVATKVAGISHYRGGEELRRAAAALAGPSISLQSETTTDGEEPTLPHVNPTPVRLGDNPDIGVRELAFTAQRYAKAAAKNPGDYEAVYNHGLALQELAGRAPGSKAEHMRLLQQACDRYEAAWQLKESSHAALYNWGVALSDMARQHSADGAPQDAQLCLTAAAEKYALSLKWNPNNPQALNNWGLVLQELSSSRTSAERAFLVSHSIAKFRGAIRLRPEFDRACYNLGTVFYAHATSQQHEQQSQLSSALQGDPRAAAARDQAAESTMRRTFALAAQYIALSYALQPNKEVYQKSLQVVQQYLPLPYLKSGYLTSVAPGSAGSSREAWERNFHVLDEASFRMGSPSTSAASPSGQAIASGKGRGIELEDVAVVKSCWDPSLPEGSAFWISLHSRPQGLYFVSDDAEDAEAWVDAIHMASHIARQQRLSALSAALARPKQQQQRPGS